MEARAASSSPPKKKIVFWIEKSVPDEYRAAVREGILEWNKAFEKIGFRDAIEVRQQEDEDFDPEDMNYNTFRWITTDRASPWGRRGPTRYTGEIIDADIIFDASMVRFYKRDQQLYRTDAGVTTEPDSPIQAARHGLVVPRTAMPWRLRRAGTTKADEPVRRPTRHRFKAYRAGLCQCALAQADRAGPGRRRRWPPRVDLKPGDKLPDELIQPGHQGGGRCTRSGTRSACGTTSRRARCSRTTSSTTRTITRKQGLVGCVMDYNPVNLAPKGVKQGDYFTTTIGPYDYWAIEYAYKPLAGGTDGENDGAGRRSPAAGPSRATTYAHRRGPAGRADPLVNHWDLGSDPMKFAQDRIALAEELLKGLADRVVEKGEGYQRARVAFGMLLQQYGNAAFLSAQFVGGEYVYRDHKGDPTAATRSSRCRAAKQREALKFLQDQILTDKPFHFPPDQLRQAGGRPLAALGQRARVHGRRRVPAQRPGAGHPAGLPAGVARATGPWAGCRTSRPRPTRTGASRRRR